MARIGHECKFVLVSFARSMKMLEQPYIDAAMSAPTQVFTDKEHLTKPYVGYQNVVVSLNENLLNVADIDDLGQYSMAGFQMASKVLGSDFTLATKKSPLYTEVSNQARKLEMLAQRKIDALVLDINIFNHLNRSIGIEEKIYEVFPVSRYHLALRDTSLVSKFDEEFIKFRQSSQYMALLAKYNMLERL